jgi:hypothetical protein
MGKKVEFDFSAEPELTEKIEIEGYEPFEVTFRVPGGLSNLKMVAGSVVRIRTADAGAGALAAEAMIEDMLGHLTAWTLEQKISRESILAMAKADSAVVAAIYGAIRSGGARRKNSPTG